MTARQILQTGEIRGRLTVRKAAKLAGISPATYSRRKADPGTMTLAELSGLIGPMRLTDAELRELTSRASD